MPKTTKVSRSSKHESSVSGLVKFLSHKDNVKTNERVATLQKVYGVTFSKDMEQLLSAVMVSQNGVTRPEWHFSRNEITDYAIFLNDKKNLFEQAILLDQENYLGTSMEEIFGNLMYIGSLGNGDAYFAHLQYPIQGSKDESSVCENIVFFDHEVHDFSSTFAESLESLVVASDALEKVSKTNKKVDSVEVKKMMSSLKNKVNLSWHYKSLITMSGVQPAYKEGITDEGYKWKVFRALWVTYLLRDDGVHTIADALEFYERQDKVWEKIHKEKQNIHQQIEKIRASKIGDISPSVTYFLWVAYFTQNDSLLELCSVIKEKSKSPLVHDAIELVLSFYEGKRKSLGKI